MVKQKIVPQLINVARYSPTNNKSGETDIAIVISLSHTTKE